VRLYAGSASQDRINPAGRNAATGGSRELLRQRCVPTFEGELVWQEASVVSHARPIWEDAHTLGDGGERGSVQGSQVHRQVARGVAL
jgi:hypothetical protein